MLVKIKILRLPDTKTHLGIGFWTKDLSVLAPLNEVFSRFGKLDPIPEKDPQAGVRRFSLETNKWNPFHYLTDRAQDALNELYAAILTHPKLELVNKVRNVGKSRRRDENLREFMIRVLDDDESKDMVTMSVFDFSKGSIRVLFKVDADGFDQERRLLYEILGCFNFRFEYNKKKDVEEEKRNNWTEKKYDTATVLQRGDQDDPGTMMCEWVIEFRTGDPLHPLAWSKDTIRNRILGAISELGWKCLHNEKIHAQFEDGNRGGDRYYFGKGGNLNIKKSFRVFLNGMWIVKGPEVMQKFFRDVSKRAEGIAQNRKAAIAKSDPGSSRSSEQVAA